MYIHNDIVSNSQFNLSIEFSLQTHSWQLEQDVFGTTTTTKSQSFSNKKKITKSHSCKTQSFTDGCFHRDLSLNNVFNYAQRQFSIL